MGGSILRYRKVLTVLAALLATAVFSSASWAQTAVFTGRVTSTAGQPLGGASVDAYGRWTPAPEVLQSPSRALAVDVPAASAALVSMTA